MRNRSTSLALASWRLRSSLKQGVVAGTVVALASGLFAPPVFAAGSLVLWPDPVVLGTMLIGFVALIFPLNALIFKPIFRSLDERAERISGARARSATLQTQADGVLDQYQSAIREARAASEQSRQQQLARAREEQVTLTGQARRDAEGELEGARSELGRSLEEARATLRSSAEDLAQAAAEQVLGRTLS